MTKRISRTVVSSSFVELGSHLIKINTGLLRVYIMSETLYSVNDCCNITNYAHECSHRRQKVLANVRLR